MNISSLLCLLYASVLYFREANCFLNIEELQEMRYSLDILQQPINIAEVNFSEGLELASKHGQHYFCKLPSKALEMQQQHANEDKLPPDYPVSDLLKPMKSQPCLKIVKGWWTYEFCYMKLLQQYHSEDGKPIGEVINLGLHDGDFDWNNEQDVKAKMFKKKRIQKYHTQYYVNGTECNVIKHKRDSEIRFYCDEAASLPYIERIDEPSTCSYILTVKTNLICSHPHTRITYKSKPVEVQCQPLLAPESFRNFFEQKTKAELAAYEEANLILRKKRDQLRELLINLKTKVRFEADETRAMLDKDEAFSDEDGQEEEEIKTSEEDDSSAEKAFDVREIAIGFIQRFVIEEKFMEYTVEEQTELLDYTMNVVSRFRNLPSADLARLVRFEILNFIERRDSLSSGFFQNLLRGIPSSGEKKTSFGSVHIKLRQLNGDVIDEEDLSLQDPSLKKLEEDIQNELVEAGVTSKRSIEVHLVTANKKDGKLTESDVDRFKEALIEIMGGGAVEEREKERFNRLLDNYSMLYKDADAQFVLSRTKEEDDTAT